MRIRSVGCCRVGRDVSSLPLLRSLEYHSECMAVHRARAISIFGIALHQEDDALRDVRRSYKL